MKTLAILICALAAAGCTTDPAVRLARCVENNARQMPRGSQDPVPCVCETKEDAPFVVLFAPAREVPDSELLARGLVAEEVAAFRVGQLGPKPHETIEVIGPDMLVSYTSYQKRFVNFPSLEVVRKSGDPVRFNLRRSGKGIVVSDLR